MGATQLNGDHTMHLYSDPMGLLYDATKLTAGYSLQLYPHYTAGFQMQQNLAASYRFMERHAFMVGGRHFLAPKTLHVLPTGEIRGEFHPMDWSIGLGYAYKINEHFSAYVAETFIQSNIGVLGLTGSVLLHNGMVARAGIGFSWHFLSVDVAYMAAFDGLNFNRLLIGLNCSFAGELPSTLSSFSFFYQKTGIHRSGYSTYMSPPMPGARYTSRLVT